MDIDIVQSDISSIQASQQCDGGAYHSMSFIFSSHQQSNLLKSF